MKRSLGAMLAVGMAGLQLIAVLGVVFSSYLTSEQALMSHARDLLRDVGANTRAHCRSFLSPAQSAAELAARLAQNRVIAIEDPVVLERLLFQQLLIATQLSGLYYGNENGDFVYVMRDPGGPAPFRSKIILHKDGQRSVDMIWRRDDFSVAARQKDPFDTYDPRTRPWYVEAQRTGGTVWTEPYIFFSSQQPGITLGAPVMSDGRDGEQSIRGVVGVDLEISMISEFLATLNIGRHGRALIVNHNGDVIAHPDKDLIKTKDADGTLRFASIREIGDPIARAAFAAHFGSDRTIGVADETPLEFTHDGARYVSILLPTISDRLPWTIAVYAPENDFIGDLKRNRTMNILLAGLVSLVTALIGLALAEYIHRPVRAFAVRNALISQGELEPDAPAPRTYRELARANETLVQQIAARKASEHVYDQTFRLASRAMAEIDPVDGVLLRVNAQFCKITGYSQDELVGMAMTGLRHALPAGDHQPPRPLLPDLARHQELRWLRKDGTPIWVMLNAFIVRNRDGDALYGLVSAEDITDRKERDAEVEKLKSDLSHLARSTTMGQMAAGLAHELNQPLTAIAQNADTAVHLLAQGMTQDGSLHEVLQSIERQSLRAGEIIRALRGFIKKDAGARIAFDLAPLVEQTLHLMGAEAAEAGAVIETRLPAALPRIEANRVQVAQVIVNLLRNAIEAVADQPRQNRRILIEASADHQEMTICVTDTGAGVEPGINLFSQFETSKSGGMGLGLSICKTIAEANGGRIWHVRPESRPESPLETGGARFCFAVPLAQEADDHA